MNRAVVCLTAIATIAAIPSGARGGFDVSVGDIVKLSDGNGGPGGIFHIDVLYKGLVPDFDTMCVELTETINFTTQYIVSSIGTATQDTNHNLLPEAAWLFGKATIGALPLPSFDFATASRDVANALQLGIWLNTEWTFGQIEAVTHWNSTFGANYTANLKANYVDLWLQDFDASWVGIDHVKVMTLRKYVEVSATYIPKPGEEILVVGSKRYLLKTNAQDQLFMDNQPFIEEIVPELPSFSMAMTVVVAGVLLAIFSAHRRRRVALNAR